MLIKHFMLLFFFLTFLVNVEAKNKKITKEPILLTEKGKNLQTRYEEELHELKMSLEKVLPNIAPSLRESYFKARLSQTQAEKNLVVAKKEAGRVAKARGLVGHAKNHWIAKAEKGILDSIDKFAAAKTDAERETAKAELDKWEKGKQAGINALKEREAMLSEALADEPILNKNLASSQSKLEHAKSVTLTTVSSLNLDIFLENEDNDHHFLKFMTLSLATPRGLANFTQKGEKEEALIDSLLDQKLLMRQILVADGPNGGNFGRAMEIYSSILSQSQMAKAGVLQRLAVAVALEHAQPFSQRNPVAMEDGPESIDPVMRYAHYEKAFLAGELDPSFDQQSTWALRMVVNGYEPDETLAWGREMLRNYRPDHITMKDYRWRYVAAVRTDIRYGSQDNKFDQPELQFFQNILKNGGICGRRAFFGRFILRAFGIPTTARPQPGHAALAHWTPEGWVVCLGGGWGIGSTKTRYKKDLDFLANSQARENMEGFLKVKRAQWVGHLVGEEPVYGLHSKNEPGLWFGVSLYEQKRIIEAIEAKVLAAVGEDIGEANESKVKEKVVDVKVREADREIILHKDGSMTIPAVATTKPTNNTAKIKFMKSHLGGMQLHYERTGKGKETFEYEVDIEKAGKYSLTARVVTPSWKQHLFISINNSEELVDMALPFTVGQWDMTEPVELNLSKGKNTLRFSRQEERLKGISVKDFKLSPVEKS
jgi:hypothetical protein